jgi:hypothetical protein
MELAIDDISTGERRLDTSPVFATLEAEKEGLGRIGICHASESLRREACQNAMMERSVPERKTVM